ncbi:cerebellin-3-like [Saccostrea cucullata]|uniref:cerebellin-3-like n=1 Tax=Saccostrea cuccullata TaxID=36930 RepID=UPI002ED577F4
MHWISSIFVIVWIQISVIQKTKSQLLYDAHKEYYDLQKRVMKMEEEIFLLQKRIMKMGEEMCQVNQMNGKMVAFSATADRTVRQTITTGGEIIIFKSVLNNVGGGYDSETGIFTAPMAGNYAFYFSVETPSYKYLRVFLYLNYIPVAEALAGNPAGRYDAGGNMVILALEKNDRVCIKSHWDTTGQSVPIQFTINSFSGFLLF